jgi:hypothetical protein
VRSLNGVGRLFEANKSEFLRSWFLTCQNYFAPSDRWQLDVFVRNLLDEEYLIFQQKVGAGPVSRRGEPRLQMTPLQCHYKDYFVITYL